MTDLGMPVLFEIIDIYAQVLIVESIDSKLFQFDTSKLKAGLYFYRVRKEEMIYKTGKLLIK